MRLWSKTPPGKNWLLWWYPYIVLNNFQQNLIVLLTTLIKQKKAKKKKTAWRKPEQNIWHSQVFVFRGSGGSARRQYPKTTSTYGNETFTGWWYAKSIQFRCHATNSDVIMSVNIMERIPLRKCYIEIQYRMNVFFTVFSTNKVKIFLRKVIKFLIKNCNCCWDINI